MRNGHRSPPPFRTEPNFLALLFSRRTVLIALMVFVLVIVVLCVFAPLVASADPAKMSVRARLTPPGGDFLFGADAFGRDVFSRAALCRPHLAVHRAWGGRALPRSSAS